MLLAVWLLGRLLNDRFLWSQFVFWIPSIFTIVASGVLAVCALSIQLLIRGYEQVRSGGPPEGRPPFYKRYVRNPYLLLCLVWTPPALYSGFVEHRLHAEWGLTTIVRSRLIPSNTIVFWNVGGRTGEGWVEPLRTLDADLTVVSNHPNWDAVNAFRTLETRADGTRSTNLLAGMYLVDTRLRLLEWGLHTLDIEKGLGFDVRRRDGRYTNLDPGYALYLVFDPAGTVKQGSGQPLVVWVLDLPSDPTLHRQRVAREARAAIESWRGVATVLSQPATETSPAEWSNVPAESLGRRGFPEPDVIIGDFNIPRGSHSLRHLVGDMSNAYDQAGAGYTASYPRRVPFAQLDGPGLIGIVRWLIPSDVPFFHIDQTFIAPSLRATRYRTIDLRSGTHWAQFVEIQSR